MTFSLRAALVLTLGLSIMGAACGGDDGGSSSATGGTSGTGSGGSTGGGSGGTTGGGSGGTTGGGSGGSSGGGGVTWEADIKPIFSMKCGPCHTTTGVVHKLGASAADAMKAVTNTTACGTATTVGACTIVRIKNGSMPSGKGCSGDPTMDAGKAVCLTKAEQDTVQAWIAGGLKP